MQETRRMPAVDKEPPALFAVLRRDTEAAITSALADYFTEKSRWPAHIAVDIFAYWALGCPQTWWVDDGVLVPILPQSGLSARVEVLP